MTMISSVCLLVLIMATGGVTFSCRPIVQWGSLSYQDHRVHTCWDNIHGVPHAKYEIAQQSSK
jgi:hypothetical protein